MGTRHLVAVVKDGENKVAQYGQWDGYPSGQGLSVLIFLNGDGNIGRLTESIDRVRFLDEDGVDKDMMESYDKNAPEWSSDPDNRTEDQKYWFKNYISRDLGAEILENVASSSDAEIILRDSSSFAEDHLFCEYAYIINLDTNSLAVYCGGTDPAKEYDLSSLPTDEVFISDLEENDDEE
ncbi:MAG: hypothetical protein ABUJ92_00705 [Desulfobacterales bacterium]